MWKKILIYIPYIHFGQPWLGPGSQNLLFMGGRLPKNTFFSAEIP